MATELIDLTQFCHPTMPIQNEQAQTVLDRFDVFTEQIETVWEEFRKKADKETRVAADQALSAVTRLIVLLRTRAAKVC